MIEALIVTVAFGASVWYVWRYYARRPRTSGKRATGTDAGRDCPSGCSGCPPRE